MCSHTVVLFDKPTTQLGFPYAKPECRMHKISTLFAESKFIELLRNSTLL